ncbi:hypothetical protein [Silvanigrella sp.]|uniref:hypothetical protein n=1 Tax=Silvanigrella sp. TaxID=2024976 RepID=UPI0037C57001
MKLEGKDKDFKEYILYFSSLPILNIITNDYKNKFPIINNAKVNIIDNKNNIEFDTRMNIRGASSINNFKSSYALYSEDKFSNYIFSKYGFKSVQNFYSLYASYHDPSLLRDYTGHTLFNSKLNNVIHNSIKGLHIDLFINNIYFGVYILTNTIGTKTLQNNNPNKELLELIAKDRESYEIRDKFYQLVNKEDNLLINPFNFSFHTINEDTIKMSNKLMKCDKDLEKTFNKNYAFSFMTTILAIEGFDNITNNAFVALKNGKINDLINNNYKNDELFYIPWDMDHSFRTISLPPQDNDKPFTNYYSNVISKSGSLFKCYLDNTNNFKNQFNEYWKINNKNLQNEIKNIFNEKYNYLNKNYAYERDYLRWKNSPNIFSEQDKNDINIWIDERLKYLNNNILNNNKFFNLFF